MLPVAAERYRDGCAEGIHVSAQVHHEHGLMGKRLAHGASLCTARRRRRSETALVVVHLKVVLAEGPRDLRPTLPHSVAPTLARVGRAAAVDLAQARHQTGLQR